MRLHSTGYPGVMANVQQLSVNVEGVEVHVKRNVF